MKSQENLLTTIMLMLVNDKLKKGNLNKYICKLYIDIHMYVYIDILMNR